MERRVDISVIVVTYNQEETISRTLESIIAQKTKSRFEIVIGDDCSTDSTSKICEEYAGKYPDLIRYYRRDKNLGVVGNYFQCLADCKGKYIADCAGDDYWVDPFKLQREYEEMEADRDVALVHTDWRCVDKDGVNVQELEIFRNVERDKRIVYEPGEMTSWVLNHDPRGVIHLCTAMYRRDLIMSEIRENPKLFISDEYSCEDLQIQAAMAAKGKVVYLPSVTLNYSVYDESISHTPDPEKIFRCVKGNLILTERLRKHYGVSSDCLSEYYYDQLQYLVAQVWHSKNPALSREYRILKKMLPPISRSLKLKIKELIISIGCMLNY